jgi:hypothetical protein
MDTGTPEPGGDLPGHWTMQYDWGCTGNYRSTTWTLYGNGTFESSDSKYSGTWSSAGSHFHLQYNGDAPAIYDGTISGNRRHMDGTMDHPTAGHGCWYADKE